MTDLLISELYDKLTYQGEGQSIGQLCSFIRTFGCNLHCSFCFGIRKGRRVPKVVLSKDKNKKIFDVKIGDKLLTYNENKELVETTVVDVFSREVEQWYELLIEDVIYFVTPEHPFFTNRGLIEAKYLIVGDEILHCQPYDKNVFRMMTDNPMYNKDISSKVHAKIDRKKLSESISRTVKEKQKNGTYKTTWELMSEEKAIEVKKKISESKLGEKNPNWKGGSKYPNFEELKRKCASGELTICQKCGKEAKLEVHHLNNCSSDDYENNDQPDQRGYNFWASVRKDGKSLPGGILAHNGKKVQSIKYVDLTKKEFYRRPYGPKRLKVYNLSCEPYNSYLVDYMWVHNCDTFWTWRVSDKYPHDYATQIIDPKLESRRMSIKSIVDHFREMNPPMMVITGGEPMLQAKKLPELMTALINEIPALTRIEIETAGTIWNDEVADFPFVWFNVSPKLENSGNPKDLRYKPNVLKSFVNSNAAIFKFVVCEDSDLEEIQQIVDEVGIPNHKVYIMPEGISENVQRERLQYLAEAVLARRWNLTTRLHVLVWGNQRGV